MRGRSHAVFLPAGARIRIHFRRLATGEEAISPGDPPKADGMIPVPQLPWLSSQAGNRISKEIQWRLNE